MTRTRQDRLALGVLVAFPVLVYGLPAALGHPLLPGDDLYQNFPLRVLAGDLLSDGHVPAWNSLMWSGTPLLGGFNAGALYPGTFLFAVLSPIVSFVSNEIVVYAVCAVGLYLLLREHRLVPLAAAVGAASFTFAGFMPAHLRHIGLVQGMSWAPWMLLAMERLASAAPRRVLWWITLCLCGGLVLLAGEPRATTNVAIIVVIYLGALLWRTGYRRQLLVAVGFAAPVAVALGAAQLLPGLSFVDVSQRGQVDYAFFAHGSLPPELLPLLVVPYLLGGYADIGLMPSYAGSYHLPEVSGYVGILAMAALVTLPFWVRRRYDRVHAWWAMVVIGLVLALGGNTPLGRVLSHLPLYGHERLQSRNLGIVDLGLAGILACWVDSVLDAPRIVATRIRAWAERATSLLPTATVIGFVATAWIFGKGFQTHLGVPRVAASLFEDLRWYFVAAMVVALAAAAFVLGSRWLSPRARGWCLVAIVVVDLGVAMLNQELGPVNSSELSRSSSTTAAVAAALSGRGRMAVYDPEHLVGGLDDARARALTPDLTVLHDLPSVQGYGSVVDARYDAVTRAHTRRLVAPSALSGTVADQLDLQLVLVPQVYLVDDPVVAAALGEPHWKRVGSYGAYLAFENTRALGRAWVTPASGATVKVVHVDAQDGETDVVASPEPATLVRSVAFSEGWAARVGGRELAVRRMGVVQAVAVPAGTSTVTWSYHAPRARLGEVLTLVGLAVVLAVGIVAWWRRKRAVHAG